MPKTLLILKSLTLSLSSWIFWKRLFFFFLNSSFQPISQIQRSCLQNGSCCPLGETRKDIFPYCQREWGRLLPGNLIGEKWSCFLHEMVEEAGGMEGKAEVMRKWLLQPRKSSQNPNNYMHLGHQVVAQWWQTGKKQHKKKKEGAKKATTGMLLEISLSWTEFRGTRRRISMFFHWLRPPGEMYHKTLKIHAIWIFI